MKFKFLQLDSMRECIKKSNVAHVVVVVVVFENMNEILIIVGLQKKILCSSLFLRLFFCCNS